jgi:hypothetical protein
MNMQFSNIYNKQNVISYNYNVNNISFSKRNLSQITKNNNNNNLTPVNEAENSSIENTRIRWGPSIWYLFHTIAHKLKDEEFQNTIVEILDIIKSICRNLPCPSCAQHATEYIQRINYNSIRNKNDFKLFFLTFHNYVNNRTGKPMFTLDELENKYSNANTLNIVKNFISVFEYKNKSFNMIANDMQRQRQADVLKIWFNNNIQKFDY